MSDNWAMDLAREEQVYSSDSTQWDAPDDIASYETTDVDTTYPSLPASPSDFYVEQESVQKIGADDGYVSASGSNSPDTCSDVSQEDTDFSKKPDILIRRLKKNKKQRDREKKKKLYITKLKNILIASDLVDANPKGTRQFTEYQTLRYTRQLIQTLLTLKERNFHQSV